MLIQFSNSAHWIIYSVALVNNSLDFQGVNFITEIYLLFKVLNDFLWFFYNAFMAFWQRQSFSLHLKSTTCTLLKFPFVFHGSKKGFIRVWINTWVSIWWQNHIITFHLKYLSFNSMALRYELNESQPSLRLYRWGCIEGDDVWVTSTNALPEKYCTLNWVVSLRFEMSVLSCSAWSALTFKYRLLCASRSPV